MFVARCYVVVVERARWRMMERREFGNGVPFEIVSLSLFAFTAALVAPPPCPVPPCAAFLSIGPPQLCFFPSKNFSRSFHSSFVFVNLNFSERKEKREIKLLSFCVEFTSLSPFPFLFIHRHHHHHLNSSIVVVLYLITRKEKKKSKGHARLFVFHWSKMEEEKKERKNTKHKTTTGAAAAICGACGLALSLPLVFDRKLPPPPPPLFPRISLCVSISPPRHSDKHKKEEHCFDIFRSFFFFLSLSLFFL